MAKDWRTIDNEKKKYAAYLCSREWSELREKVRDRSRNTCERCRIMKMDSCHHISYERKYNETLEDLQATCNYCHSFVHGKSRTDPAREKGWLRYLVRCDISGKRPIGFEWIEPGIRGERDPVEMAVQFLYERQMDCSDVITRIETACCLSEESYTEMETDKFFTSVTGCFLDAAEELDRGLLNTAFLEWLESEQPKTENYFETLSWFDFPEPRDLPTRKSQEQRRDNSPEVKKGHG